MVVNQRSLAAGDVGLIRDEIFGLSALCRQHGVISKIIFECRNLSEEEKISLCEIASEAKCNFVKTSTGFGQGGATVHDVALMKKHVTDGVEVKAAGGIRSLEVALEMISAGATRLGTSAGVEIMEELRNHRHPVGRGSGNY